MRARAGGARSWPHGGRVPPCVPRCHAASKVGWRPASREEAASGGERKRLLPWGFAASACARESFRAAQVSARPEAQVDCAHQEAAQGGACAFITYFKMIAVMFSSSVFCDSCYFLVEQKKEAVVGEKPDPVRTHLRDMIIVPEMIGSVIGVYNGKTFNQVEIKVRTGPTAAWHAAMARFMSDLFSRPDSCLTLVLNPAAGDGWDLHGRVLHLVQARESRPPRHRRHPLFALHPPQVNVGRVGSFVRHIRLLTEVSSFRRRSATRARSPLPPISLYLSARRTAVLRAELLSWAFRSRMAVGVTCVERSSVSVISGMTQDPHSTAARAY